MKLLLTSGGLENNTIIAALKDLVQKPFQELNLAFIPTAANLEAGDKWWFIEDLDCCKRLGFKAVDIVDFSALPREVWQPRLETADVFMVEGGNTFHLMHWIVQSGLKDLLPTLLATRVYIGISAGTIVATPSLELSSAEKEPVEQIGESVIQKGLGLVDFLVEPHINNTFFPELTFDYAEAESKKASFPVYALDDNSAIKVDGSQVEVISEGAWKLFNPSKTE